MKIPVLQAKVTTKLFLLWQIDVGFYEENSSAMQQLVKGLSRQLYYVDCDLFSL